MVIQGKNIRVSIIVVRQTYRVSKSSRVLLVVYELEGKREKRKNNPWKKKLSSSRGQGNEIEFKNGNEENESCIRIVTYTMRRKEKDSHDTD